MANKNRSPQDIYPQGQSEVQNIRRNNTQQRQSIPQRTDILKTPRSGQIPDCWKCGYKFIPVHLSNCPAKNEICGICKKISHYGKMCKAEMTPRPTQRPQPRTNIQSRNTISTNQNNNYQQNKESQKY